MGKMHKIPSWIVHTRNKGCVYTSVYVSLGQSPVVLHKYLVIWYIQEIWGVYTLLHMYHIFYFAEQQIITKA